MQCEIRGLPAPSLAVETGDTLCSFLMAPGMDVTPSSFPGRGWPGQVHGAGRAEGAWSCGFWVWAKGERG